MESEISSSDSIVSLPCRYRFQKAFGSLFRRLFLRQEMKSKSASDFLRKIKPSLKIFTLRSKNINSESENLKVPLPETIYEGQTVVPLSSCTFLGLPLQVRQAIYGWVNFSDVLTLRLTCIALKHDVEFCHGLSFRLHDGRLECERILRTFAIRKLRVENFTEEVENFDSFFPYPELLKTIVIQGPISASNMESLLGIAFNLTVLKINFRMASEETGLIKIEGLEQISLESLKMLEISSNVLGNTESPSTARSIRDILYNLSCPNITTFVLRVSDELPARIQLYHKSIRNFILKHYGTLRNVNIKVKQVTLDFEGEQEEDIQVRDDWVNNENGPVRFEELSLCLNKNMNWWYSLIDAQTRLRSLYLDMTNQSWSRLILVLGRCARYLRNLSVHGLSSLTRDGTTALPVDFGFLRNLKALAMLELEHQGTQHMGLNPPIVLRTSLLPQTLNSVTLCRIRLKLHQAMFILLKLPGIQKVDLENWIDSEATLAGFLAVLTFLVKFEQTPAKNIVIEDSRTRMENQENAILKMKNVLRNQALVIQNNFELSSKLVITCFDF